ncbi:MAG TPA: DUF5694 domain-containing protein [Natrialbaceae archaeon]|nr:DUF5694 domain-containing protein [Natrialbaceae archaeon]
MTDSTNEMQTDDEAVDACRWPDPEADQIEVLLLGTIHMTDPKLDDTLSPARQRELDRLVDRLATWKPDAVAVELPDERQADVDAVYEAYRSGDRSYDEEFDIGQFSPYVDDPLRECRGEPVQVGFRLADRLDHHRVDAVDYPMTLDAHLTDEETDAMDWETVHGATDGMEFPDPDQASAEQRRDRWHDSTVLEFLRWINQEESIRSNERGHFAMTLIGPEEQYVGARIQTAWYERNLRIVENLWRAMDEDIDRLALVIGYGHVHILRHLLSDAPPFCPVDPLPVLTE